VGLIDFKPLVRVTVNGTDLTDRAFALITSVTITDAAGMVSDTAEITFSNVSFFGAAAMPNVGAEVEISLGYFLKFRKMGLFIVDEVEEADPPRAITLVCRAKIQGVSDGGRSPITQQKSRSWPNMTLGEIVQTIAGDNGLKPAITEVVSQLQPGHLDQIDESDISFLTRIAVARDLIAKPAGGYLFVGRRGDAINASGQEMPNTVLFRDDVTRWAMRRSLGETVGTVIATFRDLEQGRDEEVKAGEGEPVRRLRPRYRDESEARSVADAEARRAGRSVETLSVSMPGNPAVIAESKVVPMDFSSASVGAWVVESVTHSVTREGYKTTFSAERPE